MWSWKLCTIFVLIPGVILLSTIDDDILEFYRSLTMEERRYFYQYYLLKAVTTNSTSPRQLSARESTDELMVDIPSDVLKKLQEVDNVVDKDLPQTLYNGMMSSYQVTEDEIFSFIAASSCIVCNSFGECFDPCDSGIICCM